MKHFLSSFRLISQPILPALAFGVCTIGSLFLNSCASGGGGAGDTGYGPFDSSGNYVEAWADDPSKWRRNPTIQSLMPGNDTPPRNATPLPNATASTGEIAQVQPVTSESSMPKAANTSSPVRITPKQTTSKAVVRDTSRAPVKPKPVVVKPKVPASTRVVVRKGDTLYGLAIRYKSSVSSIQRANGMRGTMLQIGKSLVIPRK